MEQAAAERGGVDGAGGAGVAEGRGGLDGGRSAEWSSCCCGDAMVMEESARRAAAWLPAAVRSGLSPRWEVGAWAVAAAASWAAAAMAMGGMGW